MAGIKMIVLAGGFGTRLNSVVSDVPKSLAPINGVPFLEIQIKHWIAQGQNDFLFLLHYEASQIIYFLRKLKIKLSSNVRFDWLIENKPLGTGGTILNAINEDRVENDFIVVNSDTWLGSGLGLMKKALAPSIGIVETQDSSRYGEVSFCDDLILTGFREKPIDNMVSEKYWINAGIYKLSKKFFINQKKEHFSLESDLLQADIKYNNVRVVKLNVEFIDIGLPVDYYRFCESRKVKYC